MFDCADRTERARGLQVALSAVRRGDLVVVPTDSAYAVGTDAFSQRGVDLLRQAKGRGRDLPIPVLVGSPRTLGGIVTRITATGSELVEAFWPGPLTLVMYAQKTLDWDIADGGVISVRMPLHPLALELLRETGPLAMTGANLAGMPLPTTCEQAQGQLGESVRVYLDAGPLPDLPTSSVIDLTADTPVLLREGGFSADVLREVCPSLRLAGDEEP